MSSEVTDTHARLAADRAITADRHERKYLLPRSAYQAFCRSLDENLTVHRYAGEDANRLPAPQHFVTTIYFDTPSRYQFRSANEDELNNIKIRAKEYYDEHAGLAEVVSSVDDMVSCRAWLWFELKRRAGQRTEKVRFRVAKRDAPHFLERGLDCSALEENKPDLGPIADYCRALNEPLAASCIVNYRRFAWQNPSATVRVTMDVGVAYYAPPPDLWTRTRALTRASLGTARAVESRLVVEVKLREAFPAWLEQALQAGAAVESVFSKFISANRAVHGDG